MVEESRWAKYNFDPVTSTVRHRELGIWLKNKRKYKRKTPTSDLEILKSLYCTPDSYLETIACRKIQKYKAPSYCHGRLFTENYHAWFDLFTGPTSGPRLMCSDILKSEIIDETTKITILDAVAIIPPNSSVPLGSEKECTRHLIMLSKHGWLYEVNLVTGEILHKCYIPSKLNAYEVLDAKLTSKETSECTDTRFSFKYRHLSVNKESETVVVKSSHMNMDNTSAVAVCIMRVYPLQILSHFIITVQSPTINYSMKTSVVNDLLLVLAMKGSMIYFYHIDHVILKHKYATEIHLDQKVKLPPSNDIFAIGDQNIGIPYTSKPIELSTSDLPIQDIPCLFQTTAIKHSLQIGAVPIHYLVPSSKSGTSWVVRNILTNTEVASGPLECEEKWDMSHWQSIQFTADDTGRLVKQNLTSVDMLFFKPEDRDSHKQGNFQSSDVKYSLCTGYSIDVTPKQYDTDDSRIKWTYPSRISLSEEAYPAHAVTSSGRLVRRPRPLAYLASDVADPVRHLLVCVETEVELNLIVLLYYRPAGRVRPGWEHEDGGAELVVSIFDALFGKWMATYLLECDVSPCDRDSMSIMIDEDTIVFTRLPAVDQRIHYKIFRLNRRYGGSAVLHNFSYRQ
uniref:DDB1- and CUL4-associated factor 17-like n=1 Tax=Phallusia mammillata TaxID=59560 RepID=A0A6F9DAQ3_9ASCI|nr:DDB1- and CUL4-associated factor 17-like [Phallusia mammillata]